ncbi:MAG: hypothetical protein IPG99_07435 [Ignavibacteria bacterium]|nr:hypothetical protein [Ignavibacteria bacterium]
MRAGGIPTGGVSFSLSGFLPNPAMLRRFEISRMFIQLFLLAFHLESKKFYKDKTGSQRKFPYICDDAVSE